MTSYKKSEYIPLLDSDQHDRDYTSDHSSINFNERYGSQTSYKRDRRSSIESISEPHSPFNVEIIKQSWCDFKTVTLSWSNINCYAPGTSKGIFRNVKETGLFKQLLFSVNGVVKNGDLVAIMGASGAGKSTLLNVLTCRNLGRIKVEGDVKVNGISMDYNIKRVSAYVQQLDVFYGRLKVREHLMYNAVLRMGRKYRVDELEDRINSLIDELGLSSCENENINSSSHHSQGLSGSEKKLLSIACELLCDPSIIFLDEPTTGLDSKMAEKVLRILEKLSRAGKCIVCTIHQPSSLIYQMFNITYLLAEGRLIFEGNSQAALQFFSDCGFACSDNFNPADHFIHTLAIRPNLEHDCRAKVSYLSRKFQDTSAFALLKQEIQASKESANDKLTALINKQLASIPIYKASFWQEIKIQTWKQSVDQFRDVKLFILRIMQNIICTIILSLAVMPQTYNQVGVNNINGGIFAVVNNASFLAIVQFSTFVKQLQNHKHEHRNGMCRSGSFFVAHLICDLPTFFITITSTSVIIYWTIGLYPRPQEFITFYLVMLLVYQFSFSLNVQLLGAIINNLNVGLTVTALTVNVMMLLSGFLINEATIPIFFKWLSYLSCQRFGFELLTINQWQNVEQIDCTIKSKDSCYNSGLDVIKFLSFEPSYFLFNLLLFIGLITVFKIAAILVLIIKARERKLH